MLNSILSVASAPPLEFTAEGLTAAATHYGNSALQTIILFAPKLLLAGLILWIGSGIATRIYRWTAKTVTASGKIDTTLGNFAASIVRYIILGAIILTAVSILSLIHI